MSDLSGLLRPPVPVLVAGAVAGVVVAVSRCRRVAVHGTSMAPALVADDRLLLVPAWRLRIGDVIALRDPRDAGRFLVKRVAGVDRASGRLTVLGDNPTASTDSRVFGPVSRRAVLGRAVYRYAPLARAGRLA
jgi:nickel-type superoxide dismutase maturation protease